MIWQTTNDDLYPDEFKSFEGKMFLFKFEISEYNLKNNFKIYTVDEMSDDEDLIMFYLNTHPEQVSTVLK